MRDTELYRQLLGLESPWTVTRVDLAVKDQRVDIWAGHGAEARWPCPDCGTVVAVCDHAEERVWRHLDSCQFRTYLHARPPRVQCPTHGVRQVRLPWAEPRARFTTLFERLAIDVLLETDVLGATRILRISWDEAWHRQERAVARGQQAKGPRVPKRLGVDEKAVAKGQRYMTVVCDLEAATVEHVADERRQASLDSYFLTLTAAQRAAIAAIAMDMWAPYVESVCAYVPDGASKIVFDRFHIMGHMGDAVDTVRKEEHRALQAVDDQTLTGSKYLWLYGAEKMPEQHQERFLALQAMDLKTARAWVIKEHRRCSENHGLDQPRRQAAGSRTTR